jgi:FkbM family methyltransferase
MEPMYEYLKNELFLKKGYTPARVLDIGAWKGMWTEHCKTFWPDSHYTCIEAGEKHRNKLNEIANDVHIAVLGNENKKVKMYLTNTKPHKLGYTKGSSVFPWTDKFEERDMVTLQSLVGDAKFDFVKQDIQGAELMVMQGSPDIFKHAEYVLNEVNKEKINDCPSLEEMNSYMESIGFNDYETIQNPANPTQLDVLYWRQLHF